jgi:hypothetical protein
MELKGTPVTITLKPEQERVIIEAIHSGLAHTPDEALDQAFDALRARLPQPVSTPGDPTADSIAAAARRLATFGKRHGLSLGGMTIKELLRESRP